MHGAVIDNDISISLYPAAINDLTDKPLTAACCSLWPVAAMHDKRVLGESLRMSNLAECVNKR